MSGVNECMRLILSSGFAAVSLTAVPAFAQVYKWVDDKGVVNYSSEAPANGKATQLDPKSSRLSIVGTGEARKTVLASASDSALSEKLDRIERKLDAERYARAVSDAQAQKAADSWYQQCQRARRVDCDYAGTDPYHDGYWPYYGAVVLARPHFHQRPFAHHPIARPKPFGRPAFSTARSAAGARQM
ncbi:MAG TPA: DUF4124 domain-containing protein [Burkholderiales bacterium]|nr:DUF4124 domain-containing protein [Burkholderiales bacterium]